MNRRNFLQTTGAALAATALTPLASAQDAPAKKRPLKKAVNLGMAKAPGASVADRFKMIRDAGFDGVELNLPDDALSVDIIQQAKAASGLEVAGIICTPHWKFPLSDPDPANRERTVRGLQLALQQGGETRLHPRAPRAGRGQQAGRLRAVLAARDRGHQALHRRGGKGEVLHRESRTSGTSSSSTR